MARKLSPIVTSCIIVFLSLGRGVRAQEAGGEREGREAAGPTSEAAPGPGGEKEEELTVEQKIDAVFGELLGWAAAAPFYNVGEFLGIDGEEQKDADGKLLIGPGGHDSQGNAKLVPVLDADKKPVLGEDGKPLMKPAVTVKTELPFVVIWLIVAAVFFTLKMRFVNFRMFGHAIAVVRGKYDNPADVGEVTHFQALSAALSATVGLGNIAGVAIAVSLGGPGATFWMIVAGFLGMTLKFTECTLGQLYRRVDEDGHISGGPMHYLRDGLERRGLGALGAILAVFFTICCIGGSLAGGNAFQVYQSNGVLMDQMAAHDIDFFANNRWIYGVVMAALVGVVIIGGIRRIAQTAEKIVPLMCTVYVLSSLVLILANIAAVPTALAAIFRGAFSGEAIYGGMVGALIMGFRRAAFSNEAGVGSASIAHSAAKTPYAVREGIVALLEPFIDTIVVCTMTALVVIITGVYDAAEHHELIAGTKGAVLTSEAFKTVHFLGLSTWFPWVLLFAVVLFAFSTMISWSYYGERCFTNLFGPGSSIIYKVIFLAFVVLGSIMSGQNALDFGDLMILIMAFPNILGLYILGGEVKQALGEYETDLKEGKFQTYK